MIHCNSFHPENILWIRTAFCDLSTTAKFGYDRYHQRIGIDMFVRHARITNREHTDVGSLVVFYLLVPLVSVWESLKGRKKRCRYMFFKKRLYSVMNYEFYLKLIFINDLILRCLWQHLHMFIRSGSLASSCVTLRIFLYLYGLIFLLLSKFFLVVC